MRSLRCLLGIHDRVYNYDEIRVYCSRCGKDHHDLAALFAVETTAEWWQRYHDGDLTYDQLEMMVKTLWDEGFEFFDQGEGGENGSS